MTAARPLLVQCNMTTLANFDFARSSTSRPVTASCCGTLVSALTLALALGLPVAAGCADGQREGALSAEELFSLGLQHDGGSDQFAGGFTPTSAPNGGFGGGDDCVAERVPVIFVHGNGDEAKNWDFPPATGGLSAYESFAAAGYNACELFGVNWLSEAEREAPQNNFHRPEKAEMIEAFILDVLDYTGQSQVDIVSHSLGVTMSLHAIEYGTMQSTVRRFIGIAGGLRGLTSCLGVGYANPLAATCGSQNIFDSDIFGFYPDSFFIPNRHMGSRGFRAAPTSWDIEFYTLRAGKNDQILCSGAGFTASCDDSALFDDHSRVRAQLDVGHGSTAASLDFDLADWTIFTLGGGDADGVGHFRSKNNTGAIQVEMLTSQCTGTECCASYDASCE